MTAFVTSYLLVWAAVCLYVLRLDARQRRLAQTLEGLQRRLQRADESSGEVKAA